jgi:high-affinity iron transporter
LLLDILQLPSHPLADRHAPQSKRSVPVLPADMPVFDGVLLGLLFTGVVAALTFVAHRKLPYKKMLVLTGIMLGAVLLVMVGEQAQEMQLARWLPTTQIPWLANVIPGWVGLWFLVFPTIQTLTAQAIAGVLVIGSYFVARR